MMRVVLKHLVVIGWLSLMGLAENAAAQVPGVVGNEKRRVTVADVVRMTQFGDPGYIRGLSARHNVAQFVLPRATREHQRSFIKQASLMQIVATLNVTLVPAMGRYNAARATRWHTDERRDHILRKNLREL